MTQNQELDSTAARTVKTETSPVQITGHTLADLNEVRDLGASDSEASGSSAISAAIEDSGVETVMGSTDSSGNAGGGQSCGLVSSLFPSSCRGRAEAFARRLHHRLTSLGGEGDERKLGAELAPSETSWLHSGATAAPAQSQQQVLQRQPKHSSDSDLYFDFDIDDPDGPESPAEEITAAELAGLLLNPEALPLTHCPEPGSLGSESGCVFSSPASGASPESDSSEVYYDPETSEAERAEAFYDLENSDSDDPGIENGHTARVVGRIHGSPRPGEPPPPSKAESSESCSESNAFGPFRNAKTVGHKASSEDSLDTTSPSHESLWSTFDDSTMSLQDESPARSWGIGGLVAPVNVHKSHSDSEIIPSLNGANDEGDFARIKPRSLQFPGASDEAQSDTETDHSTYSSSINIPGDLTLECPSGVRVSLQDDDLLVKNEVELEVQDETVTNSEAEKMVELLKRLGTGELIDNEDENDIVEEEEEEERPRRVRRCSSLKTGKTPPGTPGRKKIVRFADVLGLDLADVRTFLDEIPKVPNSAYSDLKYDDTLIKETSPQNWHSKYLQTQTSSTLARHKPEKLLVPLFQQPGGLSDFLDKVRERQVCLENVLVQDPVSLCLSGTVRVRNLDFHKSVHIRYSLNGWQSFSDLQATYVTNSCDGFSDKFIFTLYCHTLAVGQRIEFAVRYQCKGAQYWDNNAGANYCFQCLPAVPSTSYIPITANDNGSRDWLEPAFY
ncbi:glycogen-binding subunit 76A isoform X1 [Neodiprion fabricii]|uniref:glycogen-binding subunit 76A isoform X1 n=2 Tax=Neodiprion fabricii TaxID=2872261 RepID=UPI001ED9291A|nr:glycogen-binding subunit 76A isoform X1 [Neodiprion fabricii]